jgi:hypothetical protein
VRRQHKRYYGSKIWDKFAKNASRSHHSHWSVAPTEDLHIEGSVSDFICLPADCCMANDSSTDESYCSMDCSDHKHSFNLHLDDNVSSTKDDE